MRVMTELDYLGKEVTQLSNLISELATALAPIRCMADTTYAPTGNGNSTTRSKVSTEISNMSNKISVLRENVQHLIHDLDLEDTE